MRPDRDICATLKLRSFKKKWKNAQVHRGHRPRRERLSFIAELGVDFDEHVERVLTAMQDNAAELGLDGQSE